jgi:hypothetical protein
MKVLSVITARAVWLFDLQDLNPGGKKVYANLLEWLKSEYKFEKSPTSLQGMENQGLAFQGGEFKIAEDNPISVDLTIYSDGVVGNTSSSTEDTDRFLEHALTSASEKFGLTPFNSLTLRKKLYVSELNVNLQTALNLIDTRFNEFAEKLSATLGLDERAGFHFTGLSFGTDPTIVTPPLSAFAVEIKAGAPFSENRYYSRAPLTTTLHLKLLRDFEQVLTNRTVSA